MITTALLASVLLGGGKLSDVHLKPGFEVIGSAVLTQDGKQLCSPGGSIWDLATGRGIVGETLYVSLLKGQPPIAVSRTMSQGTADISNSLALSNKRQPTHLGDAMGPDRLLYCTEAFAPIEPRNTYLVVTEARLKARGKHPNIDWVLGLPGQRDARPVSLKYLNTNTVELWVLSHRAGRHDLVRYLGSRAHPGPLREASRLRINNYPKRVVNEGFVFNSFDPAQKTFIYQTDNAHHLANLDGKILRRVNIGNLDPKRWPGLQAIWELTVPAGSIPGEKKSWQPIAASANRRLWLVRGVQSGEYKLLTL
jgi:hypothetical protein